MHQPLVSVVIPAYNCQAYVAQAVRSALEQDYPNKQVIAVNDGSTDGTLAVLRGFGDAIQVVDQTNGGPPRARNAGLHAARGDYIAFLDADDVWVQGKLSAQVAHMEAHPQVGASYTHWHVWAPAADGVFTPPAFAAIALHDLTVDARFSGWIYGRLLFECELLTTTVMVRRALVQQVGEFDLNRFSGEDYDYWIRLSRVAPISCLNAVGALYRVVPDSVSRRPHETNNEHEVIAAAIARYGLTGPDGAVVDARAVRARMDSLVFQHGYVHLRRGNPATALRAFAQNLRARPWRPKLWLHAADALVKIALRPRLRRDAPPAAP
jgi:glycosyltransferase involved in cell wall biosynthesis